MAEEDLGQTKTEAPTPRRRQEAREQGRIAVSQELTGGLLFFAGILILKLATTTLGPALLQSVQQGLRASSRHDLNAEDVQTLLYALVTQGAHLIAPLLGLLFLVALGVTVLQVGFQIVPGRLALRLERLSPLEGLGRIFSLAGVLRGLAGIVKVIVIGVIAYVICAGRARELVALGQHDLASAAQVTWDIALRLALTAAVALVVLGALDYGYQWFRVEQSLRMTKQELKDEVKQEEGDPHIKARIRKLGRELSQRRMMQDVPRATVVVTNPTHLAIALRYEKGTLSAPRVVAKGAGHIAHRIVEIARRHSVPVVERRPIAQALYKAVKVGQDIPTVLYQAVAEVLAYVYRLRGEDQVRA